jgi:hypothetical protein
MCFIASIVAKPTDRSISSAHNAVAGAFLCQNREFPNAYQVIFFEEQGILIEGAAKPAKSQTLGVVAANFCTH